MNNIPELLKRLLHLEEMDLYSLQCTVVSVEGMNCRCRPVNGDPDILDVRLVADVKDDQFVLTPKVGSVVIVSFLNSTAGFISMVSEVDKVLFKKDEIVFEIDSKFNIKKGDDNMKDILTKIVSAVSQIFILYGQNPDYTKLTEAQASINNLFE